MSTLVLTHTFAQALLLFVIDSGSNYWVYNGFHYKEGPKPISDFGLPRYVTKVDAVLNYWGSDTIYIFRYSAVKRGWYTAEMFGSGLRL